MAGIFGNMNPRTGLALQGLGLGLAQLDAGRTPNLSPVFSQLQEQDRQDQMQKAIGPALENMNPGMRKVLAAMPPALASQYIMKMMEPKAPPKGVVIGDRLVNPNTGTVMADFTSNEASGWEQLTPEAAAALGLDPNKVWQRGLSGANTGKIQEVGGSGVNVSVNTGQNGVDYGSPGNGLVWARNPDNSIQLDERGAPIAIPFQGGSVWQANQEAEAEAITSAEQAELADQSKETAANIVLDEISISRDLIAGESTLSPATGITGGIASNIDSTRAGALKNRLTTIKANIGFDKLQSMRDASPTGGALGQVSEFENRLLQSVFGSLEQSQKAEDILYNLDRLEQIYNRIINEGIPDDEARELYRENELGELASEEPSESIDFQPMDNAQLIGANIDAMSLKQLDAWEAEMDRRGL